MKDSTGESNICIKQRI